MSYGIGPIPFKILIDCYIDTNLELRYLLCKSNKTSNVFYSLLF